LQTVEDSFRAERAQRRGVRTVSELIQWINSGSNGRSPERELGGSLIIGQRSDLGVGAKRPPHGGGPGAAQRSWAGIKPETMLLLQLKPKVFVTHFLYGAYNHPNAFL
jgi:hypothetical protein